eukprot:3174025-Amphidinium_carterae.1
MIKIYIAVSQKKDLRRSCVICYVLGFVWPYFGRRANSECILTILFQKQVSASHRDAFRHSPHAMLFQMTRQTIDSIEPEMTRGTRRPLIKTKEKKRNGQTPESSPPEHEEKRQ